LQEKYAFPDDPSLSVTYL